MSAPNPYFLKLTETETLRFLDLYQKEEILWNSNLEMYRNRPARLAAAERVAKALNVRGFTAEYVLIKFKNLRSSYCQELKKVAESVSSGAEEIYRPKVFWFHKMNAFLRPFVQSRAAQSNLHFDYPDTNEVQTQEVCTTHFLDPFNGHELATPHSAGVEDPQFLTSWESYDEHSSGRSEKRLYPETTSPPPHYSKRIKQSINSTINTYNLGSDSNEDRLPAPHLPTQSEKEDSFDCFGRYIAALLRIMHPQQSCKMQLDIVTLLLNQQMHQSKPPQLISTSQQTEEVGSGPQSTGPDSGADLNVKDENISNGYVDLTNEINYES